MTDFVEFLRNSNEEMANIIKMHKSERELMNVQYSALQRKARLVRNGAKANVMIPGYTENMKIRSVGSNIINLSGCGKLADTSNCLIKRNPKGIAKSRTLNEPFIMIPKVTSSLRINKY